MSKWSREFANQLFGGKRSRKRNRGFFNFDRKTHNVKRERDNAGYQAIFDASKQHFRELRNRKR